MEFIDLWSMNVRELYRRILYSANNAIDAEDILQEVAVAAFVNFDSLKRKEEFFPWIKTIARRTFLKFYDKNRKYYLQEIDQIETHLNRDCKCNPVDFADSYIVVDEYLAKLPPLWSDALRLLLFNEMTIRSISESMGLAYSKTYYYLTKCRKELCTALSDPGGFHEHLTH